jgi:hypothetical protein
MLYELIAIVCLFTLCSLRIMCHLILIDLQVRPGSLNEVREYVERKTPFLLPLIYPSESL